MHIGMMENMKIVLMLGQSLRLTYMEITKTPLSRTYPNTDTVFGSAAVVIWSQGLPAFGAEAGILASKFL